MASMAAFLRRVRRAIWLRLVNQAGRAGWRGSLGAYVGRRFGWPLGPGLRIIIDNVDEFIQREVLAGNYEPNVIALIRALVQPGDLFVDIGANMGYMSLVAAGCGGRVHAFEPVPRLARRIRENIALNRLQDRIAVQEQAVSSSNQPRTFYIAKRLDDGSHSLIAGVPATSVESITVPCTTLDEYLRSTNSDIPALVKIDVEGAEAMVLDGATRTMESGVPPIFIFETADRLADAIGESAASVLRRFTTRGYKVFLVPEYEGAITEVTAETPIGRLANYLAVHPSSRRAGLFYERYLATGTH